MKFAAIFDMDGVLIDTYTLSNNARDNLLASHGIKLTPEEIQNYSREFLDETIRGWNEKYNFPLNEEEYLNSYHAEQKKILNNTSPDSHLLKLLEELDANHVLKGIATLSDRERAKRLLRWSGLRKYFPVLVAQEDVHNHKPSPDVFLETARRLCTPPEKCIVIEDSYYGALGAKIANMKVIGYLNTHNSPKELVEAHTLIKSFSEINYDRLSKMVE